MALTDDGAQRPLADVHHCQVVVQRARQHLRVVEREFAAAFQRHRNTPPEPSQTRRSAWDANSQALVAARYAVADAVRALADAEGELDAVWADAQRWAPEEMQ